MSDKEPLRQRDTRVAALEAALRQRDTRIAALEARLRQRDTTIAVPGDEMGSMRTEIEKLQRHAGIMARHLTRQFAPLEKRIARLELEARIATLARRGAKR